MTPTEVIGQLWARIESRDWEGLRPLLGAKVQVYWPHTRELFTGPDDFIAVQAKYPEGWSIRVLSVVAQGEQVVSEVEVPHEEFGVFRVASFWTVQGGQIQAGREYWVTVGSEAQPDWRVSLSRVLAD